MANFFQQLPKVELHAHLNGSISPSTMGNLLELHRKNWPEEKMPLDCDTLIEKGKTGTFDDPFRMFAIIHTITDTPEAVRMAARDVIKEFDDDGVKYLELRSTPREVDGRMTKTEYCKSVLEEILAARDGGLGIKVKLLLAVDRRKLDCLEETIELYKVFRTSPRYENLLVGLDISGDPRMGDLLSVMGRLEAIRSEGIKLAIHLAEVFNPEEIGAFLQFKPDRIGHGTCIHPSLGGSQELWEQLQQVKCPVEVCLTSNFTCQTVPSYSQHQAGLYHKHGIPVVLCTDDKGVFSCTLSGEYRIAAESFGWSKEEMYELSRNALEHAFMGETEKDEMRELWQCWKSENKELFI
eukprot:GFUD01023359.1.p1 GENE.GFUD01023359.1~~GFUD01023359.1.p1  ORF type:complete len:352 (+),score=103.59 GFUD01023359.1:57-1112(+)